jgi:hypothetical protein
MGCLTGCGVQRVNMGMMATQQNDPPPAARLRRMQSMFAKRRAVLLEDYEYFTAQGEPNHPNKVTRKLEARSAPRVLKSS